MLHSNDTPEYTITLQLFELTDPVKAITVCFKVLGNGFHEHCPGYHRYSTRVAASYFTSRLL